MRRKCPKYAAQVAESAAEGGAESGTADDVWLDEALKEAKCCSLSAVSAPIFARKYAFCSIFQNLPDSQAEIVEI